jgi:hypothetical protein
MRTVAVIVLSVAFVAALAMSLRSMSPDAKSTAPAVAEASIDPVDIMLKAGKDLRDETTREPF